MTNSNKVAIVALNIIAASGALTQSAEHKAIAQTSKQETQTVINQLSLASIEKSWLAIRRSAKPLALMLSRPR